MALSLLFTGCEKSLDAPQNLAVDNSLQGVDSLRTLPDIKQIAFEWTPIYADRVAGYNLYRMEGSSMKRVAVIKDKYVSHHVDTGLQPDTEYSYRMTTYSADKRESSPSPIVTVRTAGKIEPVEFVSAITGLPNRVKLVWKPHSAERVESYIIERNEFKKDKWEEIATVNGRLSAEYIDKDLKDNYVYRYQVKAKTFDGIVSKPSQMVEAHTKPLPLDIVGVKATNDLPKKILLTWTASTTNDFAHYKIYRSPNASFMYSYHGKTTVPEFEDLINDNGKTYYYKVVAVDTDGLESKMPSGPIAGSTLASLRAPSVSSVRNDASSVSISWGGDPNAVKYTVTRDGGGNKQTFTGVAESHFTDSTAVQGVAYKYNIIAIDKFGIASNPSDTVSITIPKD